MKSHLRHPASTLFAGCLVGVGALAAGPLGMAVVGGVLIGVGTEHLANQTDEGWRRLCARLFDNETRLNHHLEDALRNAFKASITGLEVTWFAKHRGHQQRRQGTDASAKATFTDLRREADAILTDRWLANLVADADAVKRFREADAKIQQSIADLLAAYLVDEDPQLVAFIGENLLDFFALCFIEELKKGNEAWRAFQILVFDGLRSGQATLLRLQLATQKQVEDLNTLLRDWKGRLDDLPAGARDATGEFALGTEADRLAEKIAAEADQTREFIAFCADVILIEQRTHFQSIDNRLADIDRRIGGHSEATLALLREILAILATVRPERGSDTERINPRIFNVHHRPNPHFTGRAGHLADLETALADTDRPVALVQAIQGLGGVGKTQLAVHYCYTHQDDYAGIWWVGADSPATLAAGYAALATDLDLPQAATPDQSVVAAAVLAYLETTPDRWLLVFDNAHTPADLDPYLPRRGRAHILITSREHHWDELATPLDVDVLSPDEARDFLLKRTNQTDVTAATALAAALGRLPLALEQAGAFIAGSRGLVTLAGYLDRYGPTLYRALGTHHAKTGNYKDTVATTWAISFAAAKNRCPPPPTSSAFAPSSPPTPSRSTSSSPVPPTFLLASPAPSPTTKRPSPSSRSSATIPSSPSTTRAPSPFTASSN